MLYYSLHPFKPQYFFPKDFLNHSLLVSLYNPYTKAGRLSWFMFRKFRFYRMLFTKYEIEEYLPEGKIKKLLGFSSQIAFNLGTKGIEQKITGLGFNGTDYFFIKCGVTELAKKNIQNEYLILKEIKLLDFVPKIIDYKAENDISLLQTTVLFGERCQKIHLDEAIFERLFELSELSPPNIIRENTTYRTVFAHGDFCPWNMMKRNKKLLIYDWEMAGFYPLGYDILTFVFQSNFILYPAKDNDKIIQENIDHLKAYFNFYGVTDWRLYTQLFAEEKIRRESCKVHSNIIDRYSKLIEYLHED